ncbi:hypothetical protein BaRGS_00001558 [Batillaria attramentaria]|uniref:Islet cell autoantigen Ica1 C-terminal domain-containing protein n=1 Tax=Batillaria attramentaria TaxID=370345 RepID=A0ABD0M785_9CAEN
MTTQTVSIIVLHLLDTSPALKSQTFQFHSLSNSVFLPVSGAQDLLTGATEPDDADKDDLSLLNEILNAPSTGEDEFTQEWQAVFGGAPMNVTPDTVPAERDPSRQQAEFMPSSLMDTQLAGLTLGQGDSFPGAFGGALGASLPQEQSPKQPAAQGTTPPKSKSPSQQPPKKGQKTDMSAWFNLFADLDPLSNPDAIGRQSEDMTDA